MTTRAAWLRTFGLLLVLGSGACDKTGSSQSQCLHPCDLQQTASVQVTGDPTSVVISTAAPCEGGGTCSAAGLCTSAFITLTQESSAAGSPDLVCHVTARWPSGATVERDLSASYTDDPCCSGYEFQSSLVSFSLPPADAGDGPD